MAVDVNADTFEKEVIEETRPVLVDFWGPGCGPCMALMPYVEGLEDKYGEEIKIIKVDASKNRRLCLNLKVLGLPTYLFYENGKEIDRFTGGHLKIADIENRIKKIIGQG